MTSFDVIRIARYMVPNDESTLESVVDELPLVADIDPYNKSIDRTPDDNIRRIAAP